MKLFVLVLAFLVTRSPVLLAQKLDVELYKIKVVTLNGNRVKGILDDVSDTHLRIGNDHLAYRYGSGQVSLAAVKKVVIRRSNRRRAAITGAIAGGLAAGFVVVQSTRKNGFRSPVVYGLNLLFTVGAGAAAGALVGHKIGNTSRRVIRPMGPDPEAAVENLRRQLEPFTYSHQNDILNRVPQ